MFAVAHHGHMQVCSRVGFVCDRTISTTYVDVQHLTRHAVMMKPEPRAYNPTCTPTASTTPQSKATMAKARYRGMLK